MTNSSDRVRRIPSHFRAEVGARLRGLREAARLRQSELASLAGLRPDRLAKYEHGQQPPPVFALSRLALALGRPVDLFLPEIPLRDEGDRLFYQQVRRAWAQPPELRRALGQLLREMCDCFENHQRGACGPPREARHASRL